ncbi:MAG: LysM peptidoglycan-binding domain-containing protein [Caldilineales bacterium]|nr:LysM peptidoglycan-binding domain-containing protein [Caldilineales bacterium]
MKLNKRTALLALTLALSVMLFVAVIATLASGMSSGELIKNGGFEHGFTSQPGCDMVGSAWGCFTTGGRGGYGFYDEGWAPVVASGAHAQLIEINTKKDFGDQGRTAGIFQTVKVVPGQVYDLSFKALMRADDVGSDGDPWRYVMLVGFSQGGSDWAQASVQEVNVGPIQDRVSPTGYYPVNLKVKAEGHYLTVFIAGRMKWGDWNKEVDFDIDNVSLIGPLARPDKKPEQPPAPAHPIVKHPPVKPPQKPPVEVTTELVCDGPNLLKNGGFEQGFGANGVGWYWLPYNNGGAANYGYYDDMWPPVVASGKHAQLLEINSYGFGAADPNRIIGIYQGLWNLQPGVTYQLSLKAMIREAVDHSDEDAHRYEVYWGYESGEWPVTKASDLDSWFGVPVSEISLRTSPGNYSAYSTTFKAPSKAMVLYLMGLKKWGTTEREVNFDFDDVQLRQCRPMKVAPPIPVHPTEPPHPEVCTYVVVRGDTLTAIAARYGTTVKELAQFNNIKNPSLIRVNQVLLVPCYMGDHPVQYDDGDHAEVNAPPADLVHIVQKGETLKKIARRYGSTVKELRTYNNIKNIRKIRVGQPILIPQS